ncbi:MAG: hypothetical protein ACPG39_01035 [Flavobacteriaceae bacterium]|jgi:hypothetical protein
MTMTDPNLKTAKKVANRWSWAYIFVIVLNGIYIALFYWLTILYDKS